MNDETLTKQLGELLKEIKTLNEEKCFLIDKCNYWENKFNNVDKLLNSIRYKIEDMPLDKKQ